MQRFWIELQVPVNAAAHFDATDVDWKDVNPGIKVNVSLDAGSDVIEAVKIYEVLVSKNEDLIATGAYIRLRLTVDPSFNTVIAQRARDMQW